MTTALLVLFCLNLSLLLVHEMDAIRHREWKMFIVLKTMPDKKAYRIFLLLHLPIYTAVLFLLLWVYRWLGFIIVDVFLLLHAVIHFLFRKHKDNGLNLPFSKIIIYAMSLIAIVHLCGNLVT